MRRVGFLRALPATLAVFAAAGFAQPARGPAIPALAMIERGQWVFRPIDGGPAARNVCLSDPATLMSLRHRGQGCSRYVIENEPTRATVHYTCPGAGHGRTTIRVETPRLIRLDTQGIADDSPFDLSFEGRRTGACSAAR